MTEKNFNYHPRGCFYAAEEARKKRMDEQKKETYLGGGIPCNEEILISGKAIPIEEYEKSKLIKITKND